MTLEQLKQAIKDQSFTDQYNTCWKFIDGNTLGWGKESAIGNTVQYEFVQTDGIIYLKHTGAFETTNDMSVDILEENPLEFILMDRHNDKKVFVLA